VKRTPCHATGDPQQQIDELRDFIRENSQR
jgi:hypothetical protein